MRIALTISTFDARQGGAESFACRVVNGLCMRGHEVTVYAETGGSEDHPFIQTPMPEAPSLIQQRGCDLHIDWGLNVPADLHRLGGGVHQAFQRYNLWSTPPALRPYKRLEHRFARKHLRTRAAEAPLLARKQACFLAVSDFIARHLAVFPGISDDQIFTLVNGVPVDRFNFHSRMRYRDDIRAVLGLDDSHLAFLFVAHNLRLKNLSLLTRVFKDFHRKVPNARLIVMGRRQPSASAPWLVNAGQVSQPERIYAAADALLHPTFFDACANAVLEAMACGCPVISSDLNGSAQIIESGTNGFVLPVRGRPAATIRKTWADTMMDLAEDPGLRRRIGRAGASLIRTRYTMEDYIPRLEKVLETVQIRKNRQP